MIVQDFREQGGEHLAAIAALIALVCVLYLDSVTSIVRIWNDDGFRHGYLIPLISGFLLWRNRSELAKVRIRPSWGGAALVVVSVWVWILARQTQIQVVEHLAVLAVVHAAVISVLGPRIYGRSAFALGYLALAVPAGLGSVPWLMQITADFSMWALRLLGIPVLREGMFFTLPGGMFEVAEACSGYNYVFSGLTLAALVAYLEFQSWWRRIGFVMLATASFVLLNGIRATAIMAIASASDMRYLARDHDWFGWLLFSAVFLILYWLARRYGDSRVDA